MHCISTVVLKFSTVAKGLTTAAEVKKLIRETSANAEIVLFDSVKESMAAIREKKIDVFSSDRIALIGNAS